MNIFAFWVDVQANQNLCWSPRSYCRFCRALAHTLFAAVISRVESKTGVSQMVVFPQT